MEKKVAKARKSLSTFNKWMFWIALIALLSGLILTVISSLELCTSACVEGQKWRLFGYKFETFGLIFFPIGLISHILSLRFPLFRTISSLMIASLAGAEVWFLYIQKMVIGGFCPVCVGIALSLFIAALSYAASFFNESFQSSKEGTMQTWTKIFPSTGMVFMGFLIAFLGVAKINPLEAQASTLKDSIAFGKDKGNIEIYVFTDWFCPACRKADPEIDKFVPEVQDTAKVFFVDAAVHPETLNYTPYNLSFMINNKDKYLQIRRALLALADKNKTPCDADIKQAVEPLGVTLKELNYSDVALGVKLFKKLVKQFEISQTPTVVIINSTTKKGKKLTGHSEITKDNALKAIESMQEK